MDSTKAFIPQSPPTPRPPAEQTTPARTDVQRSIELPPGYQLLGELGRGGMGVVVKALQVGLNRVVALKLIIAGRLASETDVARFLLEARSLAKLQHPNIVQVYEIGEFAEQPYLALEYCPNGSLEDQLDAQPVSVPTAVQYLHTLAGAVAAAHAAQLLHRDLKPENVLVAADGTLKITDFGLVKRLDSNDHLTATDCVAGTPSYMSPEQAHGLALGPACDVWALGVIFYRLLTNRLPFRGADVFSLLQAVIDHDPVRPREIVHAIPRDAELICLKCLHKDPTRRYARAAELAADLERLQNGEPILARPIGRLERAARLVRRYPVITALSVVILLSLLLGTTVSTYFAITAHQRATMVEAQRTQLDGQQLQAEIDLAKSRLAQATLHSTGGDVPMGIHLFARTVTQLAEIPAQRRGARTADLERLDWHARHNLAWWQLAHTAQLHAEFPHEFWIWDVAFSPDGKYAGTASFDGSARIWDATTGAPLTPPLALHGADPQLRKGLWIRFAPDNQSAWTVTAPTDQPRGPVKPTAMLEQWTVPTGQRLGPPLGVFLPERHAVNVVLQRDQSVWLQAAPKRLEHHRPGQAQPLHALRTEQIVHALMLTPDERTLIALMADGQLLRWNTQTGAALPPLPQVAIAPLLAERVSGLHVTPDGQRLIVSTGTGTLTIVHLPTGQVVGAVNLNGVARGLVSSRDSQSVIAVGYRPKGPKHGVGIIFNPHQGDQRMLFESASPFWAVGWLNGERSAVLATENSQPLVLDLWARQLQPLPQIPGLPFGNTRTVAVHPDGQRFLLGHASGRGAARLLRLGPSPALTAPLLFGTEIGGLCFTPDGSHVLVAHVTKGQNDQKQPIVTNAAVDLWHLGSQPPQRVRSVPIPPEGDMSGFAFTPDLRTLVCSAQEYGQIWDVTAWRLHAKFPRRTPFNQVAFSPDGSWFIVNSFVPPLTPTEQLEPPTLYDTATGQVRQRLQGINPLRQSRVAVDPQGRYVAVSETRFAREIGLWSVGTDTPRWCRSFAEDLTDIAFTPDGTALVVQFKSGLRQEWAVTDGQVRASRRAPSGGLVGYTPDGQLLWGTTSAGVQLWDAQLGTPLGPVLPARSEVIQVAWHPTQRVVALVEKPNAANKIGTELTVLRLWYLPPAPTASADHVERWAQYLSGLTLEQGEPRPLTVEEWPKLHRALQTNPIATATPPLAVPGVPLPAWLVEVPRP
jgi:WD40 repeat protein